MHLGAGRTHGDMGMMLAVATRSAPSSGPLSFTACVEDTFAIRDTYIDTESPQMPIWRHFENPPERPGVGVARLLGRQERACRI